MHVVAITVFSILCIYNHTEFIIIISNQTALKWKWGGTLEATLLCHWVGNGVAMELDLKNVRFEKIRVRLRSSIFLVDPDQTFMVAGPSSSCKMPHMSQFDQAKLVFECVNACFCVLLSWSLYVFLVIILVASPPLSK